jgi:16S rRNA (uracil1498-N3)-methyltransferase
VRVEAAGSHHLLRVIRLARGERVQVVDGAGAVGVAVLEGVADDAAILRVESRVERVVGPARVVILGVPKPALVEEAVTLGTEAGATAFLLVRARRSPPGEVRLERLARVLHAAVTQCGRADSPALLACESLAAALRSGRVPDDGARWLGDPGGDAPSPVPGSLTLAVGPEGGWDDDEATRLVAEGFAPVSFGPHVLRAPTAVAVGLGRGWQSPGTGGEGVAGGAAAPPAPGTFSG